MDVLYPKGFNLSSIEKCMIDYDCHFIAYEDDEAINSRLGTDFVILQETCFIAHVSRASTGYANEEEFKCDYDCRNRVMKDLYPNKWERSFQFDLETVDGVIHNTSPPYLLFTNECIRGYSSDHNTIIANYTRVDIPKFAEMIKSKPCNDKFFVVYLGDDQYICCNTRTLETYEYKSVIKYRVIQILCGESDDPFIQLKSEYEQLSSINPLPKFSDFQLKDIEGQPVLENTDYRLEMYDYDEEVLDMHDSKLYATYYRNATGMMVVQCSIIDGIYYLVRKNRYLHSAEDYKYTVSFTDQIPVKHQRLQFQVTEKNTLKIVQWNQLNYLTACSVTSNYTDISLEAGNDDHLELYLKRL
ncbi:hypothetical protein K450DRAFT_244842 [Umbelopsis ramanniana AG]|uniref:Uncharacterized protein n=1 Tax=Umbelopsis ramanniana AG TaxID=1314678 RepID=A0AAD5E8V1_UMBRA|nr:uncharacterized protein K450DRAFT_244842 [Umbelopsis ramanniana AG]KAI8578854.1 hypothetical protein K450DRAFT_244842 [Umbelopsis ramanniana AG]